MVAAGGMAAAGLAVEAGAQLAENIVAAVAVAVEAGAGAAAGLRLMQGGATIETVSATAAGSAAGSAAEAGAVTPGSGVLQHITSSAHLTPPRLPLLMVVMRGCCQNRSSSSQVPLLLHRRHTQAVIGQRMTLQLTRSCCSGWRAARQSGAAAASDHMQT